MFYDARRGSLARRQRPRLVCREAPGRDGGLRRPGLPPSTRALRDGHDRPAPRRAPQAARPRPPGPGRTSSGALHLDRATRLVQRATACVWRQEAIAGSRVARSHGEYKGEVETVQGGPPCLPPRFAAATRATGGSRGAGRAAVTVVTVWPCGCCGRSGRARARRVSGSWLRSSRSTWPAVATPSARLFSRRSCLRTTAQPRPCRSPWTTRAWSCAAGSRPSRPSAPSSRGRWK
jgi:hypothetical protein